MRKELYVFITPKYKKDTMRLHTMISHSLNKYDIKSRFNMYLEDVVGNIFNTKKKTTKKWEIDYHLRTLAKNKRDAIRSDYDRQREDEIQELQSIKDFKGAFLIMIPHGRGTGWLGMLGYILGLGKKVVVAGDLHKLRNQTLLYSHPNILKVEDVEVFIKRYSKGDYDVAI